MSDVLPPPPPRRADDGCWKWGAIGCVGCGFLLLLGGIAIFMIMKPWAQQYLKAMEKGQIVARDMRTVHQAINAYSQKKGRYPQKLKDLIPNFVADEKALHTSAEPNGPEFTYFAPAKDAPGGTVILQYEMPAPIPTQGAPPWTLRLTKDGRVENETYEINGRRM